jgi:hypothetical protein
MRAWMTSVMFCALASLQGCAHVQIDQLATELPHSGLEKTLSALESIHPPDRDMVQYLLDRGLLKIYSGDLTDGRQDLEAAKQLMADLGAVSATETMAAATINETLRKYSGTPSDQVLVHVMLAFGYLFAGDAEGARVEILQANVVMQQLSDGDSTSGQLASARFLAGVVYELNNEPDDAMISYRHAYEIMRERNETIPSALQTSLLNLSWTQGFHDEHERYVTAFGRERELPTDSDGEWILFYHDGVVSNKQESRFTLYTPEIDGLVSIVMPKYPPYQYRPRHLSLRSGERWQRTDIVENIEKRAREDLDDKNAALLTAATTRAIAKYHVQKGASDQNDFAGFLATVLTLASEQADLRSWNMLPSSIQIARTTAPVHVGAEIIEKNIALPAFREVTDGSHILLFANSLNDRVYTFPPIDSLEKEFTSGIRMQAVAGEFH